MMPGFKSFDSPTPKISLLPSIYRDKLLHPETEFDRSSIKEGYYKFHIRHHVYSFKKSLNIIKYHKAT